MQRRACRSDCAQQVVRDRHLERIFAHSYRPGDLVCRGGDFLSVQHPGECQFPIPHSRIDGVVKLILGHRPIRLAFVDGDDAPFDQRVEGILGRVPDPFSRSPVAGYLDGSLDWRHRVVGEGERDRLAVFRADIADGEGDDAACRLGLHDTQDVRGSGDRLPALVLLLFLDGGDDRVASGGQGGSGELVGARVLLVIDRHVQPAGEFRRGRAAGAVAQVARLHGELRVLYAVLVPRQADPRGLAGGKRASLVAAHQPVEDKRHGIVLGGDEFPCLALGDPRSSSGTVAVADDVEIPCALRDAAYGQGLAGGGPEPLPLGIPVERILHRDNLHLSVAVGSVASGEQCAAGTGGRDEPGSRCHGGYVVRHDGLRVSVGDVERERDGLFRRPVLRGFVDIGRAGDERRGEQCGRYGAQQVS